MWASHCEDFLLEGLSLGGFLAGGLVTVMAFSVRSVTMMAHVVRGSIGSVIMGL